MSPSHLHEPTYEALSPLTYCPICQKGVYQCRCYDEDDDLQARAWALAAEEGQ